VIAQSAYLLARPGLAARIGAVVPDGDALSPPVGGPWPLWGHLWPF